MEVLQENIFDKLRRMNLSRELFHVFMDLKYSLAQISRDFKINLDDLVRAFKQKDIYQLLKFFGFNIKLMFRSIDALTDFVRDGLFKIFGK